MFHRRFPRAPFSLALLLALLLLFRAAAADVSLPEAGELLPGEPDFSGFPLEGAGILYGAPDALGRCTAACALLEPGMRRTDERADVSGIHPTGMHNASYPFVKDRWVYHRCHLIGRQLGGADAAGNLFCGTEALNREGMLPWENLVAAHMRETGSRVFYRALPLYEGDGLLAVSVLLEARSLDDGGALTFRVLLRNEQPGVAIDYATGYTTRADGWESGGTSAAPRRYVLNRRTGKFHLPDCPDAASVSARNREEREADRRALLSEGFIPCGKCRP